MYISLFMYLSNFFYISLLCIFMFLSIPFHVIHPTHSIYLFTPYTCIYLFTYIFKKLDLLTQNRMQLFYTLSTGSSSFIAFYTTT